LVDKIKEVGFVE